MKPLGERRHEIHNPWVALGEELPEWELRFEPLPSGLLGLTRWAEHTITITTGLTVTERRSVASHEAAHARRGPVPDADIDAEEERCDLAAARRLIPLPALAEAMRETRDPDQLGRLLWVMPDLVVTRYRHRHPAESHWLRRALTDR